MAGQQVAGVVFVMYSKAIDNGRAGSIEADDLDRDEAAHERGHTEETQIDGSDLGIANLAMYARAYAALREPLSITLIREPQDLKAALDSAPPDVLGLSSYAWNHALALHFARYARRRNPDLLVLMGGPNFPLDEGEQARFLRSMPEVV